MEKAVGRCSVQDLLCTSVYLVAELASRAVREGVPSEPGIDEVVVTGGGQQHGLLFKCLADRVGGLPLVRESELLGGGSFVHDGAPSRPSAARDGAIAAILALLHLDQTPACPTALSAPTRRASSAA